MKKNSNLALKISEWSIVGAVVLGNLCLLSNGYEMIRNKNSKTERANRITERANSAYQFNDAEDIFQYLNLNGKGYK